MKKGKNITRTSKVPANARMKAEYCFSSFVPSNARFYFPVNAPTGKINGFNLKSK